MIALLALALAGCHGDLCPVEMAEAAALIQVGRWLFVRFVRGT